ncbi:MAG: hypothetical protein ACRBM6_04020 [Geminicoccales bacterium]
MKTTSILGVGVVCFLLLAVLTIVLAGGWIEDDLAERSLDDLTAVGQEWASVELDGRDATLSGEAPDDDAVKSAVETLSDVWGIRVVHDETAKP